MALKLVVEQCGITTKHPFVIARGSTNGYKRAWIRLVDDDGVEGWGEADPSSYYGETLETVLAAFAKLAAHLPHDPFDLEAAEARFAQLAPQHASARAALSEYGRARSQREASSRRPSASSERTSGSQCGRRSPPSSISSYTPML